MMIEILRCKMLGIMIFCGAILINCIINGNQNNATASFVGKYHLNAPCLYSVF